MRQFLKLFLVFLFASCCTQKRCNKKFPDASFSIDTSWTKDSTYFVHDTIRVQGETIYISDTLPCPELNYHRETTKNHLTATIDIRKGIVSVKCREDSLKRIIDEKNRYIESHSKQSNKEVVTAAVPDCNHQATKIDIFCYVVTSVLAGWFLYKAWRFIKAKIPV